MPSKKDSPKKLHLLRLGNQREDQRKQGFFDGRFVQRAEPSEKVYRRHHKHRNRPNDEL